jgi:predicted dithiol-disulfide oxidoreductase (DUF899 family)
MIATACAEWDASAKATLKRTPDLAQVGRFLANTRRLIICVSVQWKYRFDQSLTISSNRMDKGLRKHLIFKQISMHGKFFGK